MVAVINMNTCKPHAFLVTLFLLALGSAAVVEAFPHSFFRAHVHPSLYHALHNISEIDVFRIVIKLHEPPLPMLDIPAHTPRAQAREAVANHLQQHRRNSQSAFRDLLSSASCEFFWITNRISCTNVTRLTLLALVQHPKVAAVHPPSSMTRPKSPAASPMTRHTATDVQPNIHQVCSCSDECSVFVSISQVN
jgi:hypothetical protein